VQLSLENPVIGKLQAESVYPPTYFVRGLEVAWLAFRGSELNAEAVEAEIATLAQWVNESMERRPRTAFWKKRF
jgi:hypothetical protein